MTVTRCPCLSGLAYDDCCGRFHRAEAVAPTAEQLMRSRFSAFAVGDADYLLASWHPRTRPESVELYPEDRWYRLDVHASERGGPFDDAGLVEFTAYHRGPTGSGTLHEVSRFVREDGRWLYLDGQVS